jgi:nickel/cobalt transporter (NicO) family protein
MRRTTLPVLAGVIWALVAAGAAWAHPLGNFTVNRFSGLEISRSELTLHYVVDMAEIAAFQEIPEIDADSDGRAEETELDAYAVVLADRLRAGIALEADGDPVELEVETTDAALLPGQGGLDVLRVEIDYVGALPEARTTIAYSDANYSSRIGWKEVVAYASGGQGIAETSVPSRSISHELRSYPEDMLSNPLQLTGAEVSVAPGAAGEVPGAGRGVVEATPPELVGGWFTRLVERRALSPFFVVGAVALALGAGALHALGPGHGKTVMAGYLVSSGGRMRDAVTIGVAVSLMHTASVVALGLITLWASNLFPPETVYPWLSLTAGVVVLGLGGWLLYARLRHRKARGEGHHHQHASSGEEHHHHHHHAPANGELLSWRGLGAVALAGGLLPSPAALIVLLGAVALHRIAFGVALVAAFSVGLAAALTLIGVLVLRARAFAARRLGSRVATWIPIASATVICAVGAVLTWRAALSF